MGRTTRRRVAVILVLVLGPGLFFLGRLTSGKGSAQARGYEAGQMAGYSSGLRQGKSRGVQEGRALQVTEALPKDARAAARKAFDLGYTAGANDVFGGYDGGWYLSEPYIITLVKGSGSVTYGMGSREKLHHGVDYYLCQDTHTICQRPHR